MRTEVFQTRKGDELTLKRKITSRDQFPFIFGTHLRRHGV